MLWDACVADDALTALQLLAAGADANWAKECAAEPPPGAPEEGAQDASEPITLLEKSRACGSAQVCRAAVPVGPGAAPLPPQIEPVVAVAPVVAETADVAELTEAGDLIAPGTPAAGGEVRGRARATDRRASSISTRSPT